MHTVKISNVYFVARYIYKISQFCSKYYLKYCLTSCEGLIDNLWKRTSPSGINWCPKQLCFTHTSHHISNATSDMRWHWLLAMRKLILGALERLKQTSYLISNLIDTWLIKSKLFHVFSSNNVQTRMNSGWFRGRLACVERRASLHWEFSQSDKRASRRRAGQITNTQLRRIYRKAFYKKANTMGLDIGPTSFSNLAALSTWLRSVWPLTKKRLETMKQSMFLWCYPISTVVSKLHFYGKKLLTKAFEILTSPLYFKLRLVFVCRSSASYVSKNFVF